MDPLDECWSGLGLGLGGLDSNTIIMQLLQTEFFNH